MSFHCLRENLKFLLTDSSWPSQSLGINSLFCRQCCSTCTCDWHVRCPFKTHHNWNHAFPQLGPRDDPAHKIRSVCTRPPVKLHVPMAHACVWGICQSTYTRVLGTEVRYQLRFSHSFQSGSKTFSLLFYLTLWTVECSYNLMFIVGPFRTV